jgi:hypothetical protein
MTLLLGFAYGHWTSGIINGAVSIAIGEATIFTSPNQLISGWEKYRSGGGASPAVTFHVTPTAGPGLGVLMRFSDLHTLCSRLHSVVIGAARKRGCTGPCNTSRNPLAVRS